MARADAYEDFTATVITVHNVLRNCMTQVLKVTMSFNSFNIVLSVQQNRSRMDTSFFFFFVTADFNIVIFPTHCFVASSLPQWRPLRVVWLLTKVLRGPPFYRLECNASSLH